MTRQFLQFLALLALQVHSANAFVGRNQRKLSTCNPQWQATKHPMEESSLDAQLVDSEDEIQPRNDQRQLLLGVVGALCLSTGLLLADSLPANALDLVNTHTADTSHLEVATNMISSSVMTKTPSIDLSSAAATAAGPPVDWNAIFSKASKKALGGGKAGASAAVVQVLSLMWLRTSMNYQYRYGGNLKSSLQTLWQEGGIPRLYQGLPFALVQGPLTRFGDTAANVGILAFLEITPETQALPLPIKTLLGSIAAGTWRIVLMPIDASKTAMQVEGAEGLSNLWDLAVQKGPAPLYQGALAAAAATAVGHFPWYTTYNYLNVALPEISKDDDLLLALARSALIGFTASCISDVCSNSLRVIKTTKQTAGLSGSDKEEEEDISYGQVVKLILEQDGIVGLFGRGLQTRLLTNSIQGATFSVLWKYFQQSNGSA